MADQSLKRRRSVGPKQGAAEAAPSRSRFSRLLRRLRVPISLLLLAGLLSQLDLRHSLQILYDANPGLIVLTFVLVVAERLFAAYRWHMLLVGKSPTVTLGQITRLIFVSSFLGFFVPGGGMGFEALRIYGLSRQSSDLALAVSSVLVERALALAALILLVLIGLTLSPPGLPPMIAPVALGGLAALSGGCIAVMSGRSRRLLDRLLPQAHLGRVRGALAKLYVNLDAYRGQPQRIAAAAALAVAFQLLRIGQAVVAASALGLEVPVVYFVVLMPIILLLILLPISVAGLGVREVGFVYLFGLVGVSAEAAFTLSLLIYSFNILSTLPGAWFYAKGGLSS